MLTEIKRFSSYSLQVDIRARMKKFEVCGICTVLSSQAVDMCTVVILRYLRGNGMSASFSISCEVIAQNTHMSFKSFLINRIPLCLYHVVVIITM